MFIAMNRFRVTHGAGADFEKVWTSRDSHLGGVPGFIAFHLLRGPDREDHVLYSSHTIWRSRADFEASNSLRGVPPRAQRRRQQPQSLSRSP